MQAAFIHAIRDIRMGTLPVPSPANDRLRLAVAGVGICGSDLHYYLEGGIGAARIAEPFVPGHEFSARVIDDNAAAYGFSKGQLVAVDPAEPCGACEHCHDAHPNLCPNVRFTGAPPYNGALTEQILARPEALFALPDSMTATEAVMLEPLGVAIHALDLARPEILDSVAILGAGPIGLLIAQLVRLTGAGPILMVDPLAYRREVALHHGAEAAFASVADITERTKGRGADLVIEATNSPLGFAHAVDAARIGGRIVLVGIPEHDTYSGLVASAMRRKGLTIRMSRRMGDVYPRAIRLVAERKVDVTTMVTHRFDLADTGKAFATVADYADGAVKALVYPNGPEA
jgi:L-iditol 2-dehydrogenase